MKSQKSVFLWFSPTARAGPRFSGNSLTSIHATVAGPVSFLLRPPSTEHRAASPPPPCSFPVTTRRWTGGVLADSITLPGTAMLWSCWQEDLNAASALRKLIAQKSNNNLISWIRVLGYSIKQVASIRNLSWYLWHLYKINIIAILVEKAKRKR